MELQKVKQCLDAADPIRAERPGAVEAAVALVLAGAAPDADLDLLLIRRAVRADDPWSGHMALPGGRRDPADGTLLDTAVRETREETGVDLNGGQLLGRLDDLAPTISRLPSIIVRPYVFGFLAQPAVHPNVEVAAYRWVGLDDLRRSIGIAEVAVRGRSRSVGAYRLGSDVVWGMTHRILVPFLQRLEASG